MHAHDLSENTVVPHLLSQVMDSCLNGITLSDPNQDDCPIVYANAAFELMTGYDQTDIIGRNCRFLQGDDRRQKSLGAIKDAMDRHEAVTVILRNYRKDGTLFYNELTVKPLFNPDGEVAYYAGIQNDITAEIEAELENMAMEKMIAGRAGQRTEAA